MIAAIFRLLPLDGIRGMAMARLVYGPICLGVYIPLFMQLRRARAARPSPEAPVALCGEVQ
jgi:hypothetical protein